jgi:alkylation response protein AidB-like acyl-CoA dehydrogenase
LNFEFSSDQNFIRDNARRFLDLNCPLSVARKVLEDRTGYSDTLWRKITNLGWAGAAISEDFGGLGLGYEELSILAEELGRACAPVPFSSCAYLAAEVIKLAGNEQQQSEWLPKLASGQVIGTFALTEQPGRATPQSIGTVASGNRVRGTKIPVPDGTIAKLLVVLARDDLGDGGTLYLLSADQTGVSVDTVPTLDPTRGSARILFNNAYAEPLGARGQGWSIAKRLFDRAAILFAWEQVGGAAAALEQARTYALQRYAFGRPIASFQAIKHKLATMYVNNTLARSNCYYGAWALSSDSTDLPLAAAGARVSATKAYHFASKENIQIHGGVGFTWDFDCQFHYRRAKALSVVIGGPLQWQENLLTAAISQRQLKSDQRMVERV